MSIDRCKNALAIIRTQLTADEVPTDEPEKHGIYRVTVPVATYERSQKLHAAIAAALARAGFDIRSSGTAVATGAHSVSISVDVGGVRGL